MHLAVVTLLGLMLLDRSQNKRQAPAMMQRSQVNTLAIVAMMANHGGQAYVFLMVDECNDNGNGRALNGHRFNPNASGRWRGGRRQKWKAY